MFQRIIQFFVRIVQRYLPDPFIFAILLTVVAAVAAALLCQQSPIEIIEHWGDGVWDLLAFSMQMALVLIAGSALAAAPAIEKGINKMAKIPQTPAAAIAWVTLISSIACWLNWGFGLIIGAVFAKAIARQLRGVDYRLLIASAYSGFVVWHAGLSGSIPLTMATEGDALSKATHGILNNPIPISTTLLHPINLSIVVAVILALTFVNTMLQKRITSPVAINPELLKEEVVNTTHRANTPSEKMGESRIISWIIVAFGISYLVIKNVIHGKGIDLNTIIMLFLFAGIIFHGTPMAYVKAFTLSAKGAAGIILQFPFYAGIMGIITGVNAAGISMGSIISDTCISISTPTTYPLLTFLSAAVLNVFVPSGGGQWAIQAPIMFSAGANLGVSPELTGMAIAWGDAWTNLIQPFWAIPALAIAKLNAKDIMGFCLLDLIISGVIICIGLLIWA